MALLSKTSSSIRLIIWFIIPILVGTALLLLPVSTERGSVSPIDVLFTATSAFCVTGLTVVNIPETYSTVGEIILLVLMQLGGMGVMAFSTMFFLVLGARISSGQTFDFKQTFSSKGDIRTWSILKSVFLVTVIVEGIGVIFLFIPFARIMDPLKALYFAIFHSISAFNNAGLSISPNNLQDFHGDVLIALGIAFLIIIGGLGFTVNMDILHRLRYASERVHSSLHTKIVVVTTIILILFGTICFLLLEMDNAYRDYPLGTKIVDAFFQSVTPRTAGFDTVPQGKLSLISVHVVILLMLIGASPGSTGGGIKTSSFAIIVMAIVARIKGSYDVDIFKRTVAMESVIKAVSIFILAIFLVFVSTLALMLFESGFNPDGMVKGAELDYLFETVSAFGTVGLSLGITPYLHPPGKLILIALMIIGRVGLLTMFYVVAKPEGADRISYSEETVMIG